MAMAAGWDPGPGPGLGIAGVPPSPLSHRARAGRRAGRLTKSAARCCGPVLKSRPLPHPPEQLLLGRSCRATLNSWDPA